MSLDQIGEVILGIIASIGSIVALIQKIFRSKEVKALEEELDKLKEEFKKLIGKDVNKPIDKKDKKE